MFQDLQNLIFKSINELIKNDMILINQKVNERTICGRIAMYVENNARIFGITNHYCDVEYNRQQNDEGGRALKTIINQKHKIIKINCDIILRSRGKIIPKEINRENFDSHDNLICIELKYENNKKGRQDDIDRIQALTKQSYDDIWSADGMAHPKHVCGYIVGAFIDIRHNGFYIDIYRDGQFIETVIVGI